MVLLQPGNPRSQHSLALISDHWEAIPSIISILSLPHVTQIRKNLQSPLWQPQSRRTWSPSTALETFKPLYSQSVAHLQLWEEHQLQCESPVCSLLPVGPGASGWTSVDCFCICKMGQKKTYCLLFLWDLDEIHIHPLSDPEFSRTETTFFSFFLVLHLLSTYIYWDPYKISKGQILKYCLCLREANSPR